MNKTRDTSLADEHRPDAIARRLKQPPRSQNISDAVLGAIDGCVTTFAVVSGALGAGFSPVIALVLGCANLVADGFSMAISNYESIKAQREFAETTRMSEEKHIDEVPDGEREEIRQIFQNKGFSGEILDRIVDTISQDRHLWIETMLTEEHGLQKHPANPVRSAITTFIAFILVGAMPLTPFIFTALETGTQYLSSFIIAGFMFFMIGMMKSYVFSKPVLYSGLSTLFTGSIAAGLAFAAGHLLRTTFNI